MFDIDFQGNKNSSESVLNYYSLPLLLFVILRPEKIKCLNWKKKGEKILATLSSKFWQRQNSKMITDWEKTSHTSAYSIVV